MRSEEIPEPWASFLLQVDNSLKRKVELHCFGGFVATLFYGLARSTADIDIFQATDRGIVNELMSLAGKGSALHLKHKIYLDFVSVASVPEGYERRLTDMFPGAFKHLRLLAFDPYDIALAKLERNIQRDRDDEAPGSNNSIRSWYPQRPISRRTATVARKS